MKRLVDVVFAVLMLVLLAPVIAIIAILVSRWLGKPVFFRQTRVGKDEHLFELVKFRSMTTERGPDGELLPDAERLTRFGKALRASSLDELPTLWNVLKGDMSLVGPRPLLVEYIPLYNETQKRRHEVQPGVTGWAQINGRNSLSWEEKFELDVWYVDNHSLLMDMKILFLTLKKVFLKDGISAEGEATMERFKGTTTSGK